MDSFRTVAPLIYKPLIITISCTLIAASLKGYEVPSCKLIKNDKIQNIMKTHIQKCIFWCNKYSVPYNVIANDNIFLRTCEEETLENNE